MRKKIYFLGNPSSPHVRHWEMLLEFSNMSAEVHCIVEHSGNSVLVKNCQTLTPVFTRVFPSTINYILAGILLRLKKLLRQNSPEFFHAHNTSGYGLVALLSGYRYIITTYGSEIYTAKQRGWIYRRMISTVLNNSILITSTSRQMTESLMYDFAIPMEKIREFSLGVSPNFSYSKDIDELTRKEMNVPFGSRVWISSRRIHPHYRIVEIVEAFVKFKQSNAEGFLIVLQGDFDEIYFKEIEALVVGRVDVFVVKGFIAQADLINYLCAADFFFSIPVTDQLSSSILEGIACDAVPILNDLRAYLPLSNSYVPMSTSKGKLVDQLLEVFTKTAQMSAEEIDVLRCKAKLSVERYCSRDIALQNLRAIYNPFS